MAWIWSDELAACAGIAGIDDDRLDGWTRQPVAHWLPPGDDAADLARRLLGLEVSRVSPDTATSTAPPARLCDCIAEPVGEILAPRAVAG